MEACSSRELEARNYLEKHRIMELLNYLTSSLVFYKPGKGLGYHLAFCPANLPTQAVPQKSPVQPFLHALHWWRPRPSQTPYRHHLQTHTLLSLLLEPLCCQLMAAFNETSTY